MATWLCSFWVHASLSQILWQGTCGTEKCLILSWTEDREVDREEPRTRCSLENMSPVTYFFQPGPASHHLPIMTSNYGSFNGLTHWWRQNPYDPITSQWLNSPTGTKPSIHELIQTITLCPFLFLLYITPSCWLNYPSSIPSAQFTYLKFWLMLSIIFG
jgi:hypothetical protein